MNNLNTQTVARELSKADRRFLNWANRKGTIDRERGILLEGSKLIGESLDAGVSLKLIWTTPAYAESSNRIIDRLRGAECPIKLVSEKLMQRISTMDTAPGIVAAAVEPGYIYLNPGDPFSLIVVLTKAQDPGNVGAVIRICDYFGVDELWLGEHSADPFSARSLRGAMGATFRQTVLRTDRLHDRLLEFKKAGASLWATTPRSKDTESTISPSGARILMIGGEAQGLSKDFFKLADFNTSIRGMGMGESLNLAVATGILVYNATLNKFKPLEGINVDN